MRRFILHTHDRAHSFDLNTPAALATEPSGLGNGFSPAYKESDRGKILTNVTPNFEPISLKIYFNADATSGYDNYKRLLNFLTRCGTSSFLFEYDDGVTDKYCDVILKSHTKSEINEDGIFCESFSFERQSYWYERIDTTFALKSNSPRNASFPLSFPLGFVGQSVEKSVTLTNPFFELAPIFLTIQGGIGHTLEVFVKDPVSGLRVSTLKIKYQLHEWERLVIDPTEKRITVIDKVGKERNGYQLTDKTAQSFLYLPQGTYTVGSNITGEDSGSIELSVKRYMLD